MPLHYEGWKHFRQGRAEVERAFAEAGIEDRVRWPEAATPVTDRGLMEEGRLRPDPERLGGLAWARRSGGRLTRAERRHLLAEIAKGQVENLIGRAKLALGRLPDGASDIDVAPSSRRIRRSRARPRRRAQSNPR